jgi:hypothetical protein
MREKVAEAEAAAEAAAEAQAEASPLPPLPRSPLQARAR